jgi:hypothetical protein
VPWDWDGAGWANAFPTAKHIMSRVNVALFFSCLGSFCLLFLMGS